MAAIYTDTTLLSPSVVADGTQRQVRGTRDGAIFTADWTMALLMEGRVYGVNVGTGTSPTTFNAAFAVAEQDLFLHVPTSVTVLPLYISVQFEDTGTAAALDVMAVASSTGDAAVTGTAKTIYNMRTDAPQSSGCTATAVVTSNGTDTLAGNFIEFWRPTAGFAEDAFNGSTAFVNNKVHESHWSWRDAGVPPMVHAGGSISVTCGAQAGIGFITLIFAAVPASRFS